MVTSLADSGTGSLRNAIDQSNTNPGADTIEFETGLSGEITLTSGELTLSDTSGATTINGLGADQLTISGGGVSRVLSVGSGVSATISGLTISDGNADSGGGILNHGSLTITSSTISGNQSVGGNNNGILNLGNGGGIFNYGALSVTSSTISGNSSIGSGSGIYTYFTGTLSISGSTITKNVATASGIIAGSGGGIATSGATTISGSTISDNTALNGGFGGGIVNLTDNTLTITNSTINGNSSDYGGGISNFGTLTITGSTINGNTTESGDPGFGGGIYNSGDLDIINSTISGNTVYTSGEGGGIYNKDGSTLTITNSTLSGNTVDGDSSGGGILNAADLTLNNTIIANSYGGKDVHNVLSGNLSGSHNLIEDGDTSGLSDTITGQDPMLGSLQNNGGTTFTMSLLEGSPAIDAGDNALALDAADNTLTTDQRGEGFPRILDGTVDLGAFEYRERLVVTNLADSGTGSLRDAIAQANSNPGADTIEFDSSLSGQITLTSGGLVLSDVTGATTIEGLGADLLSISGNNHSNVFDVQTGVTVELSGLTIRDGYAQNGGGIYNDGTLTITGSAISGNTADGPTIGGLGGGIYNSTSGTLTISGSTLSGNTAAYGSGGGAFNKGTMTIINTTISGNSASGVGGGGVANYATLTMTNCTVSGNTNDSDSIDGGGGVANSGTLTLNNTIIANSLNGGDLENHGSGSMSGSHNLIESGDTTGLSNTITGLDPMLGNLQNNGGPTETFALLAGSPAINAGDNTVAVDASGNLLTTDQRGDGFGRIIDSIVDMGAFELQTSVITVTNLADSGAGSFRDAVDQANSNPGDDIIGFDSSLMGETISLTSGPLTLSDTTGTTTIQGLGSNQLAVSGNNVTTVFVVEPNAKAEIIGLTITEGSTFGSGGGISSFGVLSINETTVSGSTGEFGSRAGGIANYDGGTMTINNSTITGNSANYQGGGIVNDGVMTITNSTISGNTSGEDGGGISNYGTLTITNATISGNTASYSGGGIFNEGGLILNNTIVANNRSGNQYPDLRSNTSLPEAQVSGSNNLIEDGDATGLTNTIAGQDPMLGTLQDNGGPTQTLALLAGSPAINVGDNSLANDSTGTPLTTDQRGTGFDRISGDTVDLGAFEYQSSESNAVTLTTSFNGRNGQLRMDGHDGDDAFGLIGRGDGLVEVWGDTTGDGEFDAFLESFHNVTSLRVDLGAGDNVLAIGGDLQLRKKLTVIGGNEADRVFFVSGDGSGEGFFGFDGPPTVDAKVRIQLGSGDNQVGFEGASFRKSVKVRLGSGDDDLVSTGATFESDLKIVTRGGADTLTHTNNTYHGAARFKLGDGDDTYSETDGMFDECWIAHGGRGSDTQEDSANHVAGSKLLKRFEDIVSPRTTFDRNLWDVTDSDEDWAG